MSAWSLFSESCKFEAEDIHIVLGPRISHINTNKVSTSVLTNIQDLYNKNAEGKYDSIDLYANVLEMHRRVAEKLRIEEKKLKQEREEA